MSLAEALALLDEPTAHRELRHVIAGLCLDTRAGTEETANDVAQETTRLLKYCDGERLRRTGAVALVETPEDADTSCPKTMVAVAEKISA